MSILDFDPMTWATIYEIPDFSGGDWKRGTGHRETWQRGTRSNWGVKFLCCMEYSPNLTGAPWLGFPVPPHCGSDSTSCRHCSTGRRSVCVCVLCVVTWRHVIGDACCSFIQQSQLDSASDRPTTLIFTVAIADRPPLIDDVHGQCCSSSAMSACCMWTPYAAASAR